MICYAVGNNIEPFSRALRAFLLMAIQYGAVGFRFEAGLGSFAFGSRIGIPAVDMHHVGARDGSL